MLLSELLSEGERFALEDICADYTDVISTPARRALSNWRRRLLTRSAGWWACRRESLVTNPLPYKRGASLCRKYTCVFYIPLRWIARASTSGS
jgi:hypothetical protein